MAGLLGFSLYPRGTSRAFLLGLWISYIVFCLAFTYHIRFAGHYHLQFAFTLALSSGPLIDLFINRLKEGSYQWFSRMLLVSTFLLVVFITYKDIRQVLNGIATIESEKTAQEIGEIVNHSTQTVYLAQTYGVALEYYGKLSGMYWPRKDIHWAFQQAGDDSQSIDERLKSLGFSPEYFIITDFNEFENHHADLKTYLADNCPLIAKDKEYLIYSACTK